MADLQFGIRITADGTAFVNGVEVAKTAVEDLAKEAQAAGTQIKSSLTTGTVGAAIASGAKTAQAALDSLGTTAKGVGDAFRSGLASGIKEGVRAFDNQVAASNRFLQSLKDETAQIGLNTLQKRQYAVQQAALAAPTDELRQKIQAEGQAFVAASRAAGEHTGALTSVGRSILAFIGIAAGIQLARTWAESSDAITLLNARLGLVTGSTQDLAKAQDLLRAMASRLQLPYTELGGTFARIGTAVKDLGGSLATTAKLTEALATGAKLSGASTAEASASMTQFAQALGRGVLNGDELRSILENNLRFAKALADGLGVTVGDLKRLGEEGKLTAEKVVQAVIGQLPVLQAELSKIPVTIGGAFTAMTNEIQRAFSGGGAAGIVAGFVKTVADDLKRLNDLAAATPQRLAAIADQERTITFFQRLKTALFDAATGFTAYGSAAALDRADRNARTAVGLITQGKPAAEDAEVLGARNALSRLQDELKKADTVEGINRRAKEKLDILKADFETARRGLPEAAAKVAAEYNRAVAAIDRERQASIAKLNKKVAGPQIGLPDLEGAIKAQLALTKAQYDGQFAIQDDADKRAQAQLKASYDLRLISEEDYYTQADAIQTRRAQESVDKLTSELNAELAAIQKLEDLKAQAKGPTKSVEVAKLNTEIINQLTKQTEIEAKLAIATAARGDIAVAAANRQLAADRANEKALLSLISSYDDFAKSIKDEIEARDFEISLIGKTEKAQAILTEQHRIDLRLKQELLKIDKEAAALGDTATQVQIQGYLDLRQAVIATSEAEKERATAQIGALQTAKEWADAAKQIETSLTDALLRGFESGKGFASNFRDTLVNMFKTLVLRPIIQPIAQSAATAATGLLSSFGSGFAQGAVGGTPQAGGGIGSYLGSNAGSLLSTGASAIGLGSLAGGAGSGVLGSLGASAATLGIAAEAGTAAVGGLAATAVAAIPVIGWVIAAAAILYTVFSKKDPSKVKGQLGITADTTGFEDNAYTASRFGNIGFRDVNTQQFSGEAAQIFNKVIAGALDAVAARLNEDQIKRLKEKLQNTTFSTVEGDYNTEDFLKRYGFDALKTVLSAAFGELNAGMASLIEHFRGTADELSIFANGLLGLQDALNVDPAKIALENYTSSTRGSTDTIALLRAEAVKAAEAFDGSAASIARSTLALNNYNGALAEQLTVILHMRDTLAQMFDQTRTQLEFAGLDKQAAYELSNVKGTDYLNRALAETNPELIQNYADKVNQFFLQGFNLLDPAEQLAQKDQFLAHLNSIDQQINARLTALGSDLISESTGPADQTRAALDRLAQQAEQGQATADQNTATVQAAAALVDRQEALTARDEVTAGRIDAAIGRFESIIIPVQIYDNRSPAVGT